MYLYCFTITHHEKKCFLSSAVAVRRWTPQRRSFFRFRQPSWSCWFAMPATSEWSQRVSPSAPPSWPSALERRMSWKRVMTTHWKTPKTWRIPRRSDASAAALCKVWTLLSLPLLVETGMGFLQHNWSVFVRFGLCFLYPFLWKREWAFCNTIDLSLQGLDFAFFTPSCGNGNGLSATQLICLCKVEHDIDLLPILLLTWTLMRKVWDCWQVFLGMRFRLLGTAAYQTPWLLKQVANEDYWFWNFSAMSMKN